MELLWTGNAKCDLKEIIEYIANDSKETALEKLFEIKENTKQLISFPNHGRIIPELKKQNIIQFREVIVSPWRIMYKVSEDKIYIMAVIDGRRNIEDILMKRQLR